MPSPSDQAIPDPIRAISRGIGQVFFQENAITGAIFVLGIVLNSPVMAVGAVLGAVIGWGTAVVAKFDRAEIEAGLYGFNSTLVGIAMCFFFRPGLLSVLLLVAGCVAASFVTLLMRRFLAFPTYTTPFIVVTWAVFFLGLGLGAPRVEPAAEPEGSVSVPAPTAAVVPSIEAVFHGIGQVKFQGSVVTGALFLLGIALSNWRHAAWVLSASVIATGLAVLFHASNADIALGIYGYNATLAAIALSLWRRSLIAPLLGIALSVPVTESFPMLGLPTLTAPFVLSTWLVLAIGWLEGKLFAPETSPAP